jgi:hypothetical protein
VNHAAVSQFPPEYHRMMTRTVAPADPSTFLLLGWDLVRSTTRTQGSCQLSRTPEKDSALGRSRSCGPFDGSRMWCSIRRPRDTGKRRRPFGLPATCESSPHRRSHVDTGFLAVGSRPLMTTVRHAIARGGFLLGTRGRLVADPYSAIIGSLSRLPPEETVHGAPHFAYRLG